jgi:hypothetical protein
MLHVKRVNILQVSLSADIGVEFLKNTLSKGHNISEGRAIAQVPLQSGLSSMAVFL